jgi:acylphosphatase
MEIRRASLTIKGRVQGVFFRESARREADRLGLKGFVRNLESGDVEAVAEGSEQAVEQFIAWCHQGPPSARVEHVGVARQSPSHQFSGFTVER